MQSQTGLRVYLLYAAINPASGRLIALLLPDMSKASFALFVEHFGRETKAVHGNHKVVLIADGAGSHQKPVCEQWGVAFKKLPPARPQLNPVERFFEELRKELSNQVFDTIGKVENCLCRILKSYFDHPETLVQLCHYPYIRDA